MRQRIGSSFPSEAGEVGAVDALPLLYGLEGGSPDEGDQLRQGTMTVVGLLSIAS